MLITSCFILVTLCSLTFVSGHNWLSNQGRAQLASTLYPWPIKIGNSPHIQVAANQTFTVDWSTGHGNIFTLYNSRVFSYFIVLNIEDINQVPLTPNGIETIISQYMTQAPQSAILTESFWNKNHLLPPLTEISRGKTINNPQYWSMFNDTSTDYFLKQAQMNDINYIHRDPVMMQKCKQLAISGQICTLTNPPSQWIYKSNQLNFDIRYEYYNPNFPWIESLHQFQTSVTETSYTNSYTSANFRIPARKGPGNYMLWFLWRGYYDVIDVNVQPDTVVNRYGIANASSASTYTRVDHCEFTNFENPQTPCRVVNPASLDISECITDCNNNANCQEIQVTRVKNLPTTLPAIVNIPSVWWNSTSLVTLVSGPTVIGECGYQTVAERTQAGCSIVTPTCNLAKLQAQPTDYICWGSTYITNATLQATNGWTVVTEPEDPIFYSSCYFRSFAGRFLPSPSYPQILPHWIAGDHCVDCKFINSTLGLPTHITPNWEKYVYLESEGVCVECDRQD